jgi:hypothetical protein
MDTGSLADPFVGGLHGLRQIIIRHDLRR